MFASGDGRGSQSQSVQLFEQIVNATKKQIGRCEVNAGVCSWYIKSADETATSVNYDGERQDYYFVRGGRGPIGQRRRWNGTVLHYCTYLYGEIAENVSITVRDFRLADTIYYWCGDELICCGLQCCANGGV